MDIHEYDYSNAKEFDQLCEDAASAVFAVPTTQGQFAMQVVIQNLVMPRNITGLDRKNMKAWITRKLQVIMATRTVLDEKP